MLWGLDINGGIGSAGGVGGLLAVTDHAASKTYFPCFDGNGNVVAYTDAEGGCIAEYEYSPSPGIISKTGTKADELAAVASFSTMPHDKELDAFLYPMRAVKYGRFMSRDPKDEPGFITFCSVHGDSYTRRNRCLSPLPIRENRISSLAISSIAPDFKPRIKRPRNSRFGTA